MGRRSLFWKLYATYLVAVALCAVAVGWYSVTAARDFYLDETENDLQARARLVEQAIAGSLADGDRANLARLLGGLDVASGTRITVIAPSGVVMGDSEASAGSMENHRDRPEVHSALLGGVGRAIHYSQTKHEDMMYVAVPVRGDNGSVQAVIRTAVPLAGVNEALNALTWRIVLISGLVALAAAGIGLLVSQRISGQMRRLQAGAERFAAGDFGRTLPVPSTLEFARVTESLNEMAGRLDGTIRTITEDRNEREAMLASMVEGVFAVDGEERVITMNESAARLLGVTAPEAAGRTIQELARYPELQRFVARSASGDTPVETEVVVRSSDPRFTRYLQAHAAPLRDSEGAARGAVVVLNDVTRLKRLETVRRDFVANVSHEIKTPVTSIKGFAETLLDEERGGSADGERFLRIIVAQADRLNAIIEDLLVLARLEQETEEEAIPLEPGRVCDVLELAVGACELKADSKGISLDLACSPGLTATIDAPLLEQAVVNLVDNAIKYSPEGATVEIRGEAGDDEVLVSVRDHGVGIGREHLPRLFERFYRVDTARSRDLGGTGLGLAIVKHIARAHGGVVMVESTPGVGSTFTIHLPE